MFFDQIIAQLGDTCGDSLYVPDKREIKHIDVKIQGQATGKVFLPPPIKEPDQPRTSSRHDVILLLSKPIKFNINQRPYTEYFA